MKKTVLFILCLLFLKSFGQEQITNLIYQTGDKSSSPSNFFEFNDLIFFEATTESFGREIWVTNKTKEVRLLKDINSGNKSSINGNFKNTATIFNNALYFIASDEFSAGELWKTDGTSTGTVLVNDINHGIQSSCPTQIASINNQIYFQAYDNEHGLELWKSDGTTSGTVLVSDILPGLQGSSPTSILSIGDDIFFIAETINSGRQIFKMTYNTIQSTIGICDDAFIIYPSPCRDYLYFNTNIDYNRICIYGLDGQLILKPNIINNQVNVSRLNTGLYFIKCTSNGKEFIKTFMKQ